MQFGVIKGECHRDDCRNKCWANIGAHLFYSSILFYSILSFGKVRVKKPKLCNTSTEYQMPSSPLKSAPALEPFFSILFTQGCFFLLVQDA